MLDLTSFSKSRLPILSAALVVLLWAFSPWSALAQDTFREPTDVIKQEGVLRITDGSSLFTFNKDGSFELEPVGMSGRTVSGTWKRSRDNDRMLVIEGLWTWVNGLSANNDKRRMVLAIYPLSGEKEKIGMRRTEVYKCYFVIEELTKIGKTAR